MREHADRVFLLLNKADHVSPSELEESLQFSRRVLSDALGRPATLYPVSARLALEGRLEDSPEKFARSGFPAFSDALCAFLMRDKEAALLASVVRRLLRLVAQARFTREVEIKSLSAPIRISTGSSGFSSRRSKRSPSPAATMRPSWIARCSGS